MSRKRICGRRLDAGPGSCWHWWDSCPTSAQHCFMRFIRERSEFADGGGIDLETARQWERKRDKAIEPQPGLDLEGHR